MATLPISRGLKVEESAGLFHAIFPNYPVLYPGRLPCFPRRAEAHERGGIFGDSKTLARCC
jgi:hypothetical protein